MLWSDERLVAVCKGFDETPEFRLADTITRAMIDMRDEYEAELESVKQERADYHAAMVAEYQNNKWRDAHIAELEAQCDSMITLALEKDKRIAELEQQLGDAVEVAVERGGRLRCLGEEVD